ADFRKDNGPAIRKVCARFVELCRKLGLLTKASVAIDGSKFKAALNLPKLDLQQPQHGSLKPPLVTARYAFFKSGKLRNRPQGLH
ncbi:MAG: hypothetical protein WBX25_01110, partial [Rhodomicrobium sp.]